jgi:hypothetical protein
MAAMQKKNKGRQESRDSGHNFAGRQVRIFHPPRVNAGCLLSTRILYGRNRYADPVHEK